MSAHSALSDIAQQYFDQKVAANPFFASAFGVPGFDHLVPDPSQAADHDRLLDLANTAQRLDDINAEHLVGQDRITYSMLRRLITDETDMLKASLRDVGLTASFSGVTTGIFSQVPNIALQTAQRSNDYLRRLSGLEHFLDAHLRRYLDAKENGRHQTRQGVETTIAQIEDYLATSIEEDTFLRPEPAGVDVLKWRHEATHIIESKIRPALRKWKEAIRDELLPNARGDDQVGVCHVPGGDEGYRAAVRQFTTTDLTPEEIHQTGLDIIAQLQDEFSEVGKRALGIDNPAEVMERLRTDTSLRYTSAEEIVADATKALREAEAAVPQWFLPYDIAPCEVREVPASIAKGSTLGYYSPPSQDGSRPGTYWINTYAPETRTKFEYEALSFHESVPGHHFQFALGQVLNDLPSFRRTSYVTAFGEGWGLYTERLSDEMGLYSSDLSRLGMLSFDAWRACRLVVDTGMHAFGWSRQKAIDYMTNNSALSDVNIANEVDRYIAWPGQALAYMIGRQHIVKLRQRAQDALGEKFDIRHFHDRILTSGSVPLATMTQIVEEWIDTETS
ncbi:DUF885 domain-containing protein [Natronoglycomyces albus]|uniref:DUF885 domain-containing protein n=1 Tax=Natronoglycomyces albus TaxID=2811108 RepID=A0A895XMX2_9ACTN|nr:DUF885 domain-containing protein [Natronoglycomyces albus]QSB06477.1 DUF885 domain-containing protein [Natronoglycomyces albus]